MDKVLRPEGFDVLSNVEHSAKQWLYWLKTFENFLEEPGANEDVRDRLNKLIVLINYVSSDVYQLFSKSSVRQDTKRDLCAACIIDPKATAK